MRKSLVAFFAAATLLAACTPAEKPVDADTATGEAMEGGLEVKADARVVQEEEAL